MDFNINKNATLPILRLELIQDGRTDFNQFYEKIQNSDIFFTMTDVETGVKKIAKKKAGVELIADNFIEKYLIIYQFTEKETSKDGRYVGEFTIEFLDGTGTLIVPILEELFININQGSIKK